MEDECIPEQLLQYFPKGRRNSWVDPRDDGWIKKLQWTADLMLEGEDEDEEDVSGI